MTGQFKFKALMFIMFSIIGLFSFAISGQATEALKPLAMRGEGANEISGFIIDNIHYNLLPHDPSKIAQVQMNVVSASMNEPVGYVAISVDQGATWVTCTQLFGTNWACTFSSKSQPAVSEYANLKIVASN